MAKIPKNEIAIVKNGSGQLSIKRSRELRLKTFKKLPGNYSQSTVHFTKRVGTVPFRQTHGSINVEDQTAQKMQISNDIS
jgi:hypothetical protein